MSETGNPEFLQVDEDLEGHRIILSVDGPDDQDDVAGHVQPPRGDDTDHIHSLMRQ
jgi:hypothetical protein